VDRDADAFLIPDASFRAAGRARLGRRADRRYKGRAVTTPPAPTLAALAADELLRSLLARYRRCAAYRDRGVLRVWRPGDLPPLEMPFATLYQAPDRFRFEFHYPHPMPRQPATRYVVGADGRVAYLQTTYPEQRPELRTFPTLPRAVAAASGVSCGCAHTIAHLLLPDVRGAGLEDLVDVEHKGRMDVAGARCHRIAGRHPYGGAMELAIGDDGALHRLAKQSAGLPVEELREAIELDPTLDPALFAPPA
jgi:hypothetical protein